jgi:hypothetical protein
VHAGKCIDRGVYTFSCGCHQSIMRARTWYLDRGFYPMEVGPRYMYIQTDGGHADRGSDGDWIGGRIRGDVRLVRIYVHTMCAYPQWRYEAAQVYIHRVALCAVR